MSTQLLAQAIRSLSAEMVNQAQSGHPGMPLGMADIAAVLWSTVLSHDPSHPTWLNRDRFVLSNGHGSALLYSLLYLSGYPLSLSDLKAFRQLHSHTPGHPEHAPDLGIETTTGPLGQGLAHAAGMAISEQQLRAHYPEVIDHFTYCFVGDGCLMEGISHEVASLAGSLQLSRLIVLWDDNGISIDGQTPAWFSDKTLQRFEAYNWHVQAIDGHNHDHILQALQQAKITNQPSLIACKTTIGFGANQAQGSASCHGAPLSQEDLAHLHQQAPWQSLNDMQLPDEILTTCNQQAAGAARYQPWQQSWQNIPEFTPQTRSATTTTAWQPPLGDENAYSME